MSVVIFISSLANAILFLIRLDAINPNKPCTWLLPVVLSPFGIITPVLSYGLVTCGIKLENDNAAQPENNEEGR